MCFWQKARYDTRESTFSEDCEFFQCQGEPRPRLRFPETVAHRLCPDGHDQPPMPSMPSSSIIHVSGGICALNGPPARPPLWSGRGPWLRARPGHFLPSSTLLGRGWWRAAGDSTPLYRQNLLSTIWPLGRQVPVGRRPARNLQPGWIRWRRRMQKKHCCRGASEDGAQELLLPLLSQHHSAHWSSVVDSWLWLPSKVFTANIEYNRIVGHHRTRFKRIRNTGTANCDDPFNE